MKIRTLKLTLTRQWFDMILSGEKKEEYREIKPHWIKILMTRGYPPAFRKYMFIEFRNGYSKESPAFKAMCEGVSIGYGRPEWGAKLGRKYFVIKIGTITKTWNIDNGTKGNK